MEVKSSSQQKIQSQMIDSDGPYRLLYCSSKGDKDGVIQEIRKGVSPNLADYNKRTALHLASCEGFTEIVVLLLGYGADVNSTDCWGHTPLEDARSFGHEEICKILKTKGGINLVGLDSPCYEIDYFEVDLENKTLIEEGTYGEVYLVRWRGTEVAAKTIRSCLASNSRVKGMNYLHQRKPNAIIHRDLTPRNILLDEAGHLKVTNFGLSKILQEEYAYSPYKMTGGTGSYRYMAPEVYRRESYGKSVDVFSFALILHEMFQGKPANQAEAPEAVADRRAYEDARPSLTSHVFPKAIKILLGDCWHKNPEFRPSFEHIIVQLEHIQENLVSKKAKRVFRGCLF
ncbi:serine/threonine-protein kinase VIK-like isoform X5 [Magnolia sinica]|uniref:serine/threonine-protein kinase VIK-like isoform X5 n=1 Tax=Magnolia sinica TaxID=86752 RepID=UPI00265AADBF|nr:serine/threonine-protein kinase VIK-like isoform X5 [Magnolia sinica]